MAGVFYKSRSKDRANDRPGLDFPLSNLGENFVLDAEAGMQAALAIFVGKGDSTDLRLIIGDGRRLYFSLGIGKGAPKVFGGVDLREVGTEDSGQRALERTLRRPVGVESQRGGGGFGQPEGSRHARLEISVTAIARDLKLGA